jgi:hypothetical protein
MPDVRSFRAADCDTDHYLVVAEVQERLAVWRISIFWNISSCSQLKQQVAFRASLFLLPPAAGFLLGLLFCTEVGGGHVSPKRRLTFNELYSITSQEIDIFQNIALFDINDTRRVQILQRCQP